MYLLIKRWLLFSLRHMFFFRTWYLTCSTALCMLSLYLKNTTFSKGLFLYFLVWFSSRLCIWFSPHSQPPSKLQLSIPPSFSPCLLSFLPPAQTSSQTQRVDGKYDWILPWLQIMCKAAGKRGPKNRERQRGSIPESEKFIWSVLLVLHEESPLEQRVFFSVV